LRIYSENVVQQSSAGTLVIGPAEIFIKDGFIQSLSPGRRDSSSSQEDLDHDLGDLLIAPAFVNAHTHLSLSSLRGLINQENYRGNVVEEVYFRFESNLSAEDVRAFVRVAALECILAGTAMVWDHYYFADALAEGFRDVGLCAAVAATLQDLEGPGARVWEQQLVSTVRIAQSAEMFRDGILAVVGPHATDTVSDELWNHVGEIATRHDLPVHAHVAQSQDEHGRIWSQYGTTPMGRLEKLGMLDLKSPFLMVHGLYVGKDEIQRLDPKRHFLGYCPSAQMQFDFPAPVHLWQEHGIGIVLGTDAGCCNDTMNVQLEMRNLAAGQLFALPHSREYRSFTNDPSVLPSQRVRTRRETLYNNSIQHATPERLLSSVWSIPGSLHPASQCGVIAPGYRANLCVYDTEHPVFWPGYDPLRSLAYSNASPAIHGMIINGEWRGTPGDFHRSIVQSDQAQEFRREADGRLRGVLERSGLSR